MLRRTFATTLVPLLVLAAASTASSVAVVTGRPAETREPATQQARRIRLVPAPQGNEARYRVREQLVGIEFPNDAIGKTGKIDGALVFENNGRIVREESKFTVDLASIASDRSMRDNFVRNNTLQTGQFPTAEFVPASATGLPAALPTAADLAFALAGDFTVHGVTKPTTWQVKGKMLNTGEFIGTATTWFKFGDFNMTVPRVRVVLSVVDSITLEMDLHLVPAAPGPGR